VQIAKNREIEASNQQIEQLRAAQVHLHWLTFYSPLFDLLAHLR
jgi:hypothetical protein